MISPSILWFRLDLRLEDNPALHAAVQRGAPVIPVFIFSPGEEEPWAPGGASRWWLHHSLAALAGELTQVGNRLILRAGPASIELPALARETGANAIFWSRRYEPAIRKRDHLLAETLRQQGIQVQEFNSALLREPDEVRNKSGRNFQVFTPFWKACLSMPDPSPPLPHPRQVKAPPKWPRSITLDDFDLLPKHNWTARIAETWTPGATAAAKRLRQFAQSALASYNTGRDIPADPGTSRLSPHLHFGELSARQVWAAIKEFSMPPTRQNDLFTPTPRANRQAWRESRFLSELGWREFSHHLLFHFPAMDHEPIRPEFKAFRWRKSPDLLQAWQQGRTGYPLVDAGMRELWHTGWMHNRVRMVAASFLVKHLLIHWHDGARWFWDTLVDADLGQNSMGWQWVAGSGADAAPFFRVFNPVLQAKRFDPDGKYIRRWIPELSKLPTPWVFEPSKAPEEILAKAGIELNKSYPQPVVSHIIAREVALEAYARMQQSKSPA